MHSNTEAHYCSLGSPESLLLFFSKAKKAESSPNAEPSDEGNSRGHSAGEWMLCELQLVQEGWHLPFGQQPFHYDPEIHLPKEIVHKVLVFLMCVLDKLWVSMLTNRKTC